ncbi:hypothetical protein HDV00_002258 [Rhizophlyctis rosea]|nr:hypothetical protein HDV00_002258 [Rhizophlyctis rosea]
MVSMKRLVCLCLIGCLLLLVPSVAAWEQEDYELFEMNDNLQRLHPNNPVDFYSVIGAERKATPAEITKAYRKTSMQLHPDRNPDPKAQELYTLLTSIVGILKEPKSRERYDAHLARGIPRWVGGGYFYNRYAPNVPMVIFLFLLAASFVQYVTSWIKYLFAQAQAKEEVANGPQLTYAQVMKQLKKAGADVDKKVLKKATPEQLAAMAAQAGSRSGSGTATPAERAEVVRPALSDTAIVTVPVWVARSLVSLVQNRGKAKGEEAVGGAEGVNGPAETVLEGEEGSSDAGIKKRRKSRRDRVVEDSDADSSASGR